MNNKILKLTIIGIISLFVLSGLNPVIATNEEEFNVISSDSIAFDYNSNMFSTENILFKNNQLSEPEIVPGEILIKFKENNLNIKKTSEGIIETGNPKIDSLHQKYNVKSQTPLFNKKDGLKELSNIYKIKLNEEEDIHTVIDEYKQASNVEYVEPNYQYSTSVIPNDPFFNLEWGLNQENDHDIDAIEAWDIETGSPDITIAVIDTGVDYTHPDLVDNIWINEDEIPDNGIDDDNNGFIDDYYGWNFCNDDNDPIDDFGHGTHCAGTIAAVANNGIGIAGVCWNSKIMCLKGLDATGSGYSDDLANCIIYAADNGADILSNSWGGYYVSQIIIDAINYAESKGVVIIAAAGNSNVDYKHYPAGYDNVISVSATDNNDEKASFSNYGSWIDIAAPGVDIFSTMPTYSVTMNDLWGYSQNYDEMSGTSMACPHVSGLAGLILSKNPDLTNDEVLSILRSNTDPVNSNKYIGIGRINAYTAIISDNLPLAELNPNLDDIIVRGKINVTGYAYGNNFSSYQIYYGVGFYPETWIEIVNSSISVQNDILTVWDTDYVNDGVYSLRLIVNDINGQFSEDRTILFVDTNEISSPDNNDIFRSGEIIEFIGSINGKDFINYELKWGFGENPSEWFNNGVILLNNGEVQLNNEILAFFDSSVILEADYVTFRLVVNYESVQKIDYVKNVFIDPTLKEGWPQKIEWETYTDDETYYIMGGFLEPVVDDLNNDGKLEIIIFQGGDPAKIKVFNHEGLLLWSKNIGSYCTSGLILSMPLVGDINNDGFKEIIAFHPGILTESSTFSELYALDHNGNVIWQTNVPRSIYQELFMADLDLDGNLEIVIKGIILSYLDDYENGSRMTILNGDGNIISQWDLPHYRWYGHINSNPAIGNFDNDPDLEIVCAGPAESAGAIFENGELIDFDCTGEITIYNLDGSIVEGWPILIKGIIVTSSPAVGDIDNDGFIDIVVSTQFAGFKPDHGGIHAFDRYGNILPGWPVGVGGVFQSSPSLADFDGDGDLEIAVSEAAGAFKTFVFHHDGTIAEGWPQYTKWNDYYSTIIADINNDGVSDILTTAGSGFYPNIENHGGVYAWNFDGTLIEGFPKVTENDAQAPATVVDLDNDGILELIATSDLDYDFHTDEPKFRGTIYVWELDEYNNQELMAWPTVHHDNHRTGLYPNNDSGQVSFNIQLFEGWNLITIPVQNTLTASTLAEMIESCGIISQWDPINQTYLSYIVSMEPNTIDFPITEGVSYFIHMEKNSNLEISGYPITNVDITLYAGNNFLGWYELESTKASEIKKSIENCLSVKIYDVNRQDYLVYESPGDPDFIISQGMGYIVEIGIPDNTPPVTIIELIGNQDDNDVFNGPVAVVLRAEDEGSGVANIFYRFENTQFQEYWKPRRNTIGNIYYISF